MNDPLVSTCQCFLKFKCVSMTCHCFHSSLQRHWTLLLGAWWRAGGQTACRTDQDIMAEQSTLYYQRSPWCLAAGAESDLDIAEFKFSCVECHHHHQTGSREKVGVMTTMVTIWPLHGHYMAILTMRPMAISVTASPVTSITCSRSHSTGQRHGEGEIQYFLFKII